MQIGEHTLFGAVAIHVDSSGWYADQHEKNTDYNSVVIIVLLYNSGKRLIKGEDNCEIPEMEFASFINKTPSTSGTEARADLKLFGGLTERCGMAIVEHGAKVMKKIIDHAAEHRIQVIMQLLLKRWDEQHPEELLFQLLFKSLGYSPFVPVFEELAKQYQFSELQPLCRQPQQTTRTRILSCWFGT